jgi:hypothetical protein
MTTTFPGSIVVYLAHRATSKETALKADSKYCESLISAAKILVASTNEYTLSFPSRFTGEVEAAKMPV